VEGGLKAAFLLHGRGDDEDRLRMPLDERSDKRRLRLRQQIIRGELQPGVEILDQLLVSRVLLDPSQETTQ